MTVGENIRKYRKARKLTQKELAERVGTDMTMISMWEKGRRSIKLDVLRKIARELDVTIYDLLDEMEDSSASIRITIERYEDLLLTEKKLEIFKKCFEAWEVKE